MLFLHFAEFYVGCNNRIRLTGRNSILTHLAETNSIPSILVGKLQFSTPTIELEVSRLGALDQFDARGLEPVTESSPISSPSSHLCLAEMGKAPFGRKGGNYQRRPTIGQKYNRRFLVDWLAGLIFSTGWLNNKRKRKKSDGDLAKTSKSYLLNTIKYNHSTIIHSFNCRG